MCEDLCKVLSQTQVVNTSLAKLASFSLYGVSPPGWLYNQHLNVYWNNSEYLASPTYFTSKNRAVGLPDLTPTEGGWWEKKT